MAWFAYLNIKWNNFLLSSFFVYSKWHRVWQHFQWDQLLWPKHKWLPMSTWNVNIFSRFYGFPLKFTSSLNFGDKISVLNEFHFSSNDTMEYYPRYNTVDPYSFLNVTIELARTHWISTSRRILYKICEYYLVDS